MNVPIRLRPLPFALAALVAAPAAAQLPAFLDAQRQVNQVIVSDQNDAAIAKSPDGTTWVVWESWGSAGNDADGRSIQMRRYSPGGLPLGAQTQVNTVTAGQQKTPAVAVDPVSGAAMVVWESPGAVAADGFDVRARLFAANGTPLGADFAVNLFVTGEQLFPAVAGEIDGFIVVWQSDDDTGPTVDLNIAARVYDSTGAPVTGELLVNEGTDGAQEVPAIAASGGNFLAVWQSATSAGSDNTTTSIQARWILGGFGAASFQVNEHPPVMADIAPAVAVFPGGAAIVVWESFGSIGNDADRYAIQARRFSAAGAPGAQFQVNSYTDDDQRSPAVVADADGRFVAAWQSFGSSGNDADGWSVQVRGFGANDAPLAGDRQANTFVTGDQWVPALAIDADGDVALAWESLGSPGDDQSLHSIQLRRLSLRLLFADGFASGNTAQWSVTVP
jgi:hypothetical protein